MSSTDISSNLCPIYFLATVTVYRDSEKGGAHVACMCNIYTTKPFYTPGQKE